MSFKGLFIGCIIVGASVIGPTSAFPQSADETFFENKIRPVLVENCYSCHNSLDDAQGGLALDWRKGTRTPSDHGTAVVPFKPEDSLLLRVINHELKGLEMPEGGAKLSPEEIADLTRWISQGAMDPRDQLPTEEQHTVESSWPATFERRKQWWSLLPLKRPVLPDASDWSVHPIDRFVKAELQKNDLEPAPPAERRVLLRRLAYALTGLPPSPAEIEQFLADSSPFAFQEKVDQYLAAPSFGEHWARHWMDLVRYADSHGSEGDPAIPNIYRYRDYLIRAFNSDVPYDQLVREHIAGDLLETPRINQSLGLNESAIGPAHLRLVFHGFAPTDALDEKVRFTDDQINVLGKAFQGLTISCARCHDHKFDAISQADYYALFGVLGSCRPAMTDVNHVVRQEQNKSELAEIKRQLKTRLADRWLAELDQTWQRLTNVLQERPEGEERGNAAELLGWLESIKSGSDAEVSFEQTWKQVSRDWNRHEVKLRESHLVENQHRWDMTRASDYQNWFAQGNGLELLPSKPGDFTVETVGNRVLGAIHPAGVFSNSLSRRHRAVLSSPNIRLDQSLRVWFKLIGGGQASVRYVVQNYPRNGTVYPIQNVNRNDWYWHHYDMKYWTGDDVHFELATSKDAPLQVGNQDRSWFGIREVLVRSSAQPAPFQDSREAIRFLWQEIENAPPQSLDELANHLQAGIRKAIQSWVSQTATDEACLFLNACLQVGLLTNEVDRLPELADLMTQYRLLESEIPAPTRVPGVTEAEPTNQPLLNRGDHKQPREPIPRRYLSAIDARLFSDNQSGRRELADALTDSDNPLTARVITNRIWHWLFGQGIVTTPDNFGKLGALPTHPELLDFLAIRMMEQGWSMKQAIRFIVLSKAWQQSSAASKRAENIDPANQYLSHANVRRLSAEAIRDSLLSVSGQLQVEPFGPGFAANRFSPRRSIYVRTNRNSLDAFLQTFDAPVPFATTGKRSETNVPAQSLTLMNDPQVIRLAKSIGQQFKEDTELESDEEKRAYLFKRIIGRPASPKELKLMADYTQSALGQTRNQQIERREILGKIQRVKRSINAILDPVRRQLQKKEPVLEFKTGLSPIAQWDFSKGLNDLVGGLPGKKVGKISRDGNGLKLQGRGFVISAPLPVAIQEKTLEVWLQIDDFNQSGGGAITIQDLQGSVFDSLVLGEQEPGQWLAGSDNFRRTEGLRGSTEKPGDSSGKTLHLALVYEANGRIRAYRNGRTYGKPYQKGSPIRFAAGQSQVVFGLRHGKEVIDGRMFRGNLLEARLYDRALTGEEIKSSSQRQMFVSRDMISEALSPEKLADLEQYEAEVAQLTVRLDDLPPAISSDEIWSRLAHSLFNLKEFIFIQ